MYYVTQSVFHVQNEKVFNIVLSAIITMAFINTEDISTVVFFALMMKIVTILTKANWLLFNVLFFGIGTNSMKLPALVLYHVQQDIFYMQIEVNA